jgi:nicotinamidase-related amidase
MVSDFNFPGGAAMARAALPVARRIGRLANRARKAGVPVIYVNDNLGRWRSDFPGLVRHCRAGSRGAPILDVLAPGPRDYAILKLRHSGFFATPLATILEYLGATTLVLTGAAMHQCVLFTANDAYVREYSLLIPRDCVASATEPQKRLASRYFRSVLGADMRPSGKIRFPRR